MHLSRERQTDGCPFTIYRNNSPANECVSLEPALPISCRNDAMYFPVTTSLLLLDCDCHGLATMSRAQPSVANAVQVS